MTYTLVALSGITMVFAATFLGLVVRYNRNFAELHALGLDPTVGFWGVWLLILVTISLSLFFAVASFFTHTAKHFEKTTLRLNVISILDTLVASCSLLAWLGFTVYFYAITQYGPLLFNGSEIALGVLTTVGAIATAVVAVFTKETILMEPSYQTGASLGAAYANPATPVGTPYATSTTPVANPATPYNPDDTKQTYNLDV